MRVANPSHRFIPTACRRIAGRSHRDSKEIEAAMMDFGGCVEVTAVAPESLDHSHALHLHDALDFRDREYHSLDPELR